jgi:hypothetical protein
MASETASDLMKLINGFQVSQAISVAATLGIPDLLRHGPRRCHELADAANAQPGALYRLLRALAAVGVLEEQQDRQFALTALGQPLASEEASSRNAWARLMGQLNYWSAWSDLLGSVQTGETAFNRVHGTSVWSYRAEHPRDAATFDRAICRAQRYRLRGILFDQPHVVTKARHLACATLADRSEVIGGDFFVAVPASADAYLLKWILHDWDDERAIAILRSCRRAMSSTSRLIVVEYMVAPPNEGPEGKFMDLNMLVITGGAERTREEFDRLFEAAGFKLVDATPTTMHATVLVAMPV